ATELERATLDTIRALMGSVDNELSRSIAAAESLAVTDALDRGNLRRFQEEARRVLMARPEWSNLVLYEPSGRQLVNALRPCGDPLPTHAIAPESLRETIDAGRATITGVAISTSTGAAAYGVRVPVIRGDQVRYVISAVVKPEAMLRVIQKLNVPAGGLV